MSPSEPSILANRVLELGSREPPSVERLIKIRELCADAGAGRFFLHVVPAIFGPDRARLLTAAGYIFYRGWQLYIGFAGETPAGTGGLFTHGDIGVLDFGATQPDFRRRGGQSTLLCARIQAAREAGCQTVVTMTGEAVVGEEQHSYRNIERAGFSAAYVRENWIPTGT